MWQISWMLSLLPEWFWTFLLISSLIGIFVSWDFEFIPFIKTYKLVIQVISTVLLLVSMFFQGMYANEAKWKARVKELEEKIAQAETESKKENTVVQEKIIYKDKIIKEKGKTQIEYVDKLIKGDTEIITKDMSESERTEFQKRLEELERSLKSCPVPKIVVEEHNKAAMAIKEINQAAKQPSKLEEVKK